MVGKWHFLWAWGDRPIFKAECEFQGGWIVTATSSDWWSSGYLFWGNPWNCESDHVRSSHLYLDEDEFFISPTSKLPWNASGAFFQGFMSFASPWGSCFSLPQNGPPWLSPPFLPSFVSSLWVPCTGQTVKKLEKYLMNLHFQTNMIYAWKWTRKCTNADTNTYKQTCIYKSDHV